MKISAILIPALFAVVSSLSVNAQDHPKRDTAAAHHDHKGPGKDGKKEFQKGDKPAHVKDSAAVKHLKPAAKQ